MIKKNIKIITAWDDTKNIFLVYKENNIRKIRKIKNYQWHFAIMREDYDKIEKTVINNFYQKNVISKIGSKNNYIKIYADRSNFGTFDLIKELEKRKIKLLEKDLSLHKRYLIDNEIEIEDNLDILFYDIETDDTKGRIEIGKSRILSWAACNTAGNTYFETGEEKEILIKLINLINKYDVFVGWNSKQFDLPYIQERMKLYDIEYNWKKRIHIDLMQRFIKLFSVMMVMLELKSFKLDDVGYTFAKKRKIKFDGKVIELYNNNPKKFKEYNINDAVLLKEINEKTQALYLMIKECKWTGTLLNKFYIGELLDSFILKEAHKINLYLPSKPKFEKIRAGIRGGYVMKPVKGLHKNVRIFDFKSLYPTVIIGWNIGMEAININLSKKGDISFDEWLNERKIEDVDFNEWCDFLMKEKKRLDFNNEYFQTANNNFFLKKRKSIIPSIVKDLLEKRKKYKKKVVESIIGTEKYANAEAAQSVVKEMANSMYGITADRNSRYFYKGIAEGITLTGQFLCRLTINTTSKLGFTPLYTDTDSVFVSVKDKDIVKFEKDLNLNLKNFIDNNFKLENNVIYIENEKKFKKFILIDKKKYSGYLVEMDNKKVSKIYSRGTENVRKNTIKITKEKMTEAIELITIKNKNSSYMKKWIKDLKEYVLNNKNISAPDIMIRTKISKPIHKYKNKTVHIILAEKLIKEGKMLEAVESKNSWGSQQINYIITDTTNKQEAVLASEFKNKWDRKYYWDVQIYAPLMRILKVCYPKENWEEHNIIMFEKMQLKKEREEAKIRREKEREKKKKEREKLKKQREKEREKKKKEKEKIKKQKEKLKAKKEAKQKKEIY